MSTSTDSSLRAVEVDPDVDVSTQIVEAVGSTAEIPVLDLPPLSDVVDPDALDTLCEDNSAVTAAFDYAGHSVTVLPEGTVEVRASE